ncbi:Fc.00g050120.m01.CDS01 [Cosmosporella sp. VM-42]
MASRKVIVFGPTGAVGSAAARTAEELGATVVLAMRDTKKPIPGLSTEKEGQGNFERVHADLTKPETIRDAVNQTGAKYAFIYLAHGMTDHMKSTIEALKSSGIQIVVFLSSFTVRGDLESIEPSEVIPYIHAQVEIQLREILGEDKFVAIRPGSFASNTRQYKAGLRNGEVRVYGLDSKVDCIVPEDIGRVSGTVLANGPPQDGERALYLYGPELMSQATCVRTLADALGQNPRIEPASEEEAYKLFVEGRGMPDALAKYMVNQPKRKVVGDSHVFGYPVPKEHLSNVEKYSGRKATTFAEWARENKEVFLS